MLTFEMAMGTYVYTKYNHSSSVYPPKGTKVLAVKALKADFKREGLSPNKKDFLIIIWKGERHLYHKSNLYE